MRYLYLLAFVCSSLIVNGQVGHSSYIISTDSGFYPLSSFTIANDQLYFAGYKYADTGEELYSVSEALLTSKKTNLAPNNTYGLTYRKFDITYPYLTALGDTIFYAGFGYDTSGQLKYGLCKYADGGTPQLIDINTRNLVASTTRNHMLYLYVEDDWHSILAYSSQTGRIDTLQTFLSTGFYLNKKGDIAISGDTLLYTNFKQLRVHYLSTGIDSSTDSNIPHLDSIDYLTVNPNDGKIYFTATRSVYGRELFVYENNQIKPVITLGNSITHGIISNFAFRSNKIYVQAATSADTAALFEYDITKQTIRKLPGTTTNFLITEHIKEFVTPDGEVAIIGNQIFYARAMRNVSTTNICKKLFSYNINNNSVYELSQLGSKPFYCDRLITFKGSLYYIGNTEIVVHSFNVNTINKYTPSPLSTTDTKHKIITTNIYPNPTTANTTLELQLDKTQSLSIKLTDITGRTVHTIPTAEYATGKHNVTLPMEQLPNGNYFYSIIDNNGMLLISGKLIKE